MYWVWGALKGFEGRYELAVKYVNRKLRGEVEAEAVDMRVLSVQMASDTTGMDELTQSRCVK